MAAPGPAPSDFLPMVRDVVERNVDTATSTAHGTSLSCGNGPTTTTTVLRPIQAVVGQAFPLVCARRSYGRQGAPTSSNKEIETSSKLNSPTTATISTLSSACALQTSRCTGLSAHIQPQDDTSTRADAYGGDDADRVFNEISYVVAPHHPIPAGGNTPMLLTGGSAHQHLQAHQWSATEFTQLLSGYYVAPISARPFPSSASSTTAVSTGEDFFTLLFQCLRSTVRKHQQLALIVLLTHLQGLTIKEDNHASDTSTAAITTTVAQFFEEASTLRERCLHGPNCGPFIFFLLEILISAGHPAMVELTATCLLLLLRGLPRGGASSEDTSSALPEGCESASLLTDAISELGNPAGDAPGEDDEEERKGEERNIKGVQRKESGKENTQDDAELPFSEVSELLRGPDARYGLEQLGFTNKVLATMPLLLLPPHADAADQKSGEDDRADTFRESTHHDQRHSETSLTETRLPPHHGQVLFLELLLCGGVGIGQRTACRRVADDPQFLRWMEKQLSSVVMGNRSLEEVMELLCVLQNLAHVPAALNSLIRGGPGEDQPMKDRARPMEARENNDDVATDTAATTITTETSATTSATQQRQRQRFYETWLLFFIYVSSTTVKDVRTVRHVFSIVWAILLLRMCVRQRRRNGAASSSAVAAMNSTLGLVHDMSDTLLTEGMTLGGALVLEMWFLQYVHAEGVAEGARQPDSLDGYFLDAARTALQLCQRSTATGNIREAAAKTPSTDSSDATVVSEEQSDNQSGTSHEAAAAQCLLHELQWLSNAHFAATYITQMRQLSPAVCYTLCGSAVETQEVMQYLVRHVVMDTTRINSAFARFTSPLLSPWFCVSKTSNRTGTTETLSETASSLAFTAVNTYPYGWVPAAQAVLHRWISPITIMCPPRNAGPTTSPIPTDISSFNARFSFNSRNIAIFHLAFAAAGAYANTRLAVALAEVYPAVARDIVTGYASLLTHAYEDACLRLRDGAAVRLQVDELCTMAEAVQFLQRSSDKKTIRTTPSGSRTTTSNDVIRNCASVVDRETRIGAFFLLHSIAISKHCLDVVPLVLPLLPFHVERQTPSSVSLTPSMAVNPISARMSLLASLRCGIELTPAPVMFSGSTTGSSSHAETLAVAGAARSWVMYPLYDTTFLEKDLWAQWLRGLLGLHHRVKDLVGWDAVLSHTLLWVLIHRRALWNSPFTETEAVAEKAPDRSKQTEVEGEEISPASAHALCALLFDLCTVLHDQCEPTADGTPREGTRTAVSASASRTLEISLTAYSDVPSEEGLPPLLHAVVAYVAAHCSVRTALAALQALLAAPLLHFSAGKAAAANTWTNTVGLTIISTSDSVSSSFPYARATAQVCAWLQTWSALQEPRDRSVNGAYWGLDDVVALLQLVGPHLGHEDLDQGDKIHISDDPTSTDDLWCVRCLTDGLLRHYLQQRLATSGALSAMEKAVLRSTLEELEWFPSVLWTQVETG